MVTLAFMWNKIYFLNFMWTRGRNITKKSNKHFRAPQKSFNATMITVAFLEIYFAHVRCVIFIFKSACLV